MRYIYLLICFFATLYSQADSQNCTIQLKSGDTLSGNMLAINSEKIKFSITNFEDQALEILRKDIKKLWFNNQFKSNLNKGGHVFILTNGDIIYGKLLKLDLKNITLHSNFLGERTIPRNSVMHISKADRKKITYLGPNDLKNWNIDSGEWLLDNGILSNTTKRLACLKT